ncbi:MAG: oligosaccharide flippase family protein [Desulfobacteraceae bacterium]|nr:oligosaccharide flippase family protein [Desulfobacteraceae bacterium]
MANKEQQIKNSFIYLLPIIAGSILPFVSLSIFTRILTREDYGVLALAQVYAVFVSGLANFGMTAAYDRNYFQYRSNRLETARLLYSIILFVTLNFLFLASLTFVFRGTLSRLIIGSAEHGNILFWAFCAQFFVGANYYYLAYFKNSETAKDFTVYTIAISLVNLIVSLFLVAYIRIGIIGLVYAQLCSGAIIFSVLSYKFITTLKPSFSKSIFIESLKISYPLTPRIFFGVISTQFDKYMIGLLATVGGVGIYSIGQRVSNSIFIFMTAIQNVFSPQVYKKMFYLKEKGGETIGKYLTPFAYVSISVALLVSLFAEEIISILTPPSYHGAIDIVIVLSMFYGFLFFGKLNGNQLIFTKKMHITSLLTMVSIGLNVGFNIPLIMKWGAIGAAWGTLLSGLISGGISFAVSQHYYEIKWEYKNIGAIFFIFFVSAILMILMRHFSVAYEFRLILKCASVFSYIYLGIKLKVITMENYTLIKNMIPLRRAVTSDHT